MTNEELEAIEALANAATPGPWRETEVGCVLTDANVSERYNQVASVMPICNKGGHCYQDDTAAFIAASREAVPALVAEVRRLRAEAAKATLDASITALVAEVERMKGEVEKSQRVFVWEFPWKDSNNVLRICWSKSLRFYLTMSDSCLELIDALTGDPFDCYDIHGVDKIGLAEQLIRELGFARDGDAFDRSRVTL